MALNIFSWVIKVIYHGVYGIKRTRSRAKVLAASVYSPNVLSPAPNHPLRGNRTQALRSECKIIIADIISDMYKLSFSLVYNSNSPT